MLGMVGQDVLWIDITLRCSRRAGTISR
eukprot:SAG31_NODE_30094_length_385_cov_1.038462_1_plen_27_part_01